MNDENLVSLATRPKRERQAIARKGAEASNKVQKQKKTMQQLAKMIAANMVTDKNGKKALEKLGITDEDMTNDALVTAAVFQSALSGDMKAVEKWMELTSEQRDEQLDKLDEVLNSMGGVI